MMRSRSSGVFGSLLLLLLGWTTAAFAELNEVSVTPPQPGSCDPVAIVAAGILPDECHRIVKAEIQGPIRVVCFPAPCAAQFRVEITVRQPNPAETCLAAQMPYSREFLVGKLPPGDYEVLAHERVIPFYPDSTDSTVSETFASVVFTVRADPTCAPGCYILTFHYPLVDPPPGPLCDATAPPGGTACVPVTLTNSVDVAGVQTTVETGRFTSGATDLFLHVVSVEPVRRATGFQVAWNEEGNRTKILLFSTAGGVIAPGDGPVLRICYAVAPDAVPDRYLVTDRETVVADPTGASVSPCQTPAVFAPGIICVVPTGCDVNRDGASDVLDIIRIARCALASAADTVPACPDSIAARADCNGDGTIDIGDVICCVRKIVGYFVGTRPGSGSDRSAAAVAGEVSQVAWDGPVRWLDAATGIAKLKVDATTDWGGTQFSIDPTVAPVRVRSLRLIGAGPGVQLEWGVAPDGITRAILFHAISVPQTSWSGRVEVTLDRMSGPASGPLQLLNVRVGTAAGETAAVGTYDPLLPVDGAPIATPVLLRARPNPFGAQTEIAFVLPADARAELKVFDVHGRLVRSLVQGPQQAGTHRISWDGMDGRGRAARSGVYFAKLTVGAVTLTERILLLR